MVRINKHKVLGDSRGRLVAIESLKNVPFEIKRIFYIYGTQRGVDRGDHAHLKTMQYLIAVHGSCKISFDDGKEVKTYDLTSPEFGLLQQPMVWGTMHDFTDDCVLLVLANEYYDEADYIRDYREFLDALNHER